MDTGEELGRFLDTEEVPDDFIWNIDEPFRIVEEQYKLVHTEVLNECPDEEVEGL